VKTTASKRTSSKALMSSVVQVRPPSVVRETNPGLALPSSWEPVTQPGVGVRNITFDES
jgi:hypothetical protein